MCDLGNALSEPDFSIVNLRGPSLPCKSLKPLTGMRDVPVANCSSRDFCSASQLRMHFISGQHLLLQTAFDDTHSPEVPDDLVLLSVASIIGVFLPVFNVDIRDSSN